MLRKKKPFEMIANIRKPERGPGLEICLGEEQVYIAKTICNLGSALYQWCNGKPRKVKITIERVK